MTFTNEERQLRCQKTLIAYSDSDPYANLVDFLADAFHFCHVSGHSLTDAFETALMHFEAELTGDDILDDLKREANERNQLMSKSIMDQHEVRKQLLTSLADDALEAFWEAVVRNYPQAETGDLSPWATMKLQIASENAIAEWIDDNVPSTATKGD